MKGKVLSLLAIITSLLGYLQWGNGNSMFLFQAEKEILSKILYNPADVIHPLIILPLIGQILLMITIIQKEPGKILSLIGVCMLGVLLGLMFLIGLIDLNFKILASTTPFLIIAVFVFRYHRKNVRIKTNR